MQKIHETGRRGRLSRPASYLVGAVALGALAATGVVEGFVQPAFTAAQAQTQTQPQAQQPIQVPQVQLPSFADIVDRVKPAVVSVRVRREGGEVADLRGRAPEFNFPEGSPFEEFFRRFREGERGPPGRDQRPPPRRGMAQGSAFFITADGYLVTNNHVVARGTNVEILTDDGRTLEAKVIGTDPRTDLALLKVEGGPFPFVKLANEQPRVGDWVLAVGNPFGLGGTVTAGIVSAQARELGSGPYDFLQIDAAVNRGNSGGPTFNLKGEVVGVNTAITSPSGGNVGIAFAVPSQTVQQVVASLRERGTVERGFLGVQIQPVTKDIAASLGLETAEGAIVARVDEDTPAARGGIRTGDVILSVEGNRVRNARELARQVGSLDPNTTAKIEVWRDGGKRTIDVRLGRMPGDQAAAGPARAEPTQLANLGLTLAPAGSTPGTDRKDGVAVVEVKPGSEAAEKGFETGDVIVEVGGKPVQTPADIERAIAETRKAGRKAVLFRVEARAGSRFVALQVPAA
ncbi:MAG TPA: Do family serine endopeptidase [Beijerinckiaceae bacterium]|nr:Do family serine endopeptidase [Beijerinckiaceae bacterium]